MKNNNQKAVRRLTRRTLRANKKRNFFLLAAITLTSLMMTSVFSIGISLVESMELSPFRLEGSRAHVAFRSPTAKQLEVLATLDYVSRVGEGGFVGTADVQGIFEDVSLFWINEDFWDFFASPTFADIEGSMAVQANEIMLSRFHLEEMGIEDPMAGMEIPLTFRVEGQETAFHETFILSAIYTEYVSSMGNAQTPFFVSQAFAASHQRDALEDRNVQILFRQAVSEQEVDLAGFRLRQDLNLLESQGFGMNPALYSNISFDAFQVQLVMGIIIAFLTLTGFLLIYNVIYISVSKDVRFYGMLKTMGTTSRQIRKIVNGQVLGLYLVGMPLGMFLAAAMSFLIIPVLLTLNTGTVVSFSPVIFIGGAFFTFMTVRLGSFTSAIKAGRLSPIEGMKFQGGSSSSLKVRSTGGGKAWKMAVRNVFREKVQASLVLASLFLGLTVFTVVMTILNSLDVDFAINSLYDHDFTVSTLDVSGFHESFIDAVDAIPEVTDLRRDLIAHARWIPSESLTPYFDWLYESNPWSFDRNQLEEKPFMLRGIDLDWVREWNETQAYPIDLAAFERGELLLVTDFSFHQLAPLEQEMIFPQGVPHEVEIGETGDIFQIAAGPAADFMLRSNAAIGFGVGMEVAVSADFLREAAPNALTAHLHLNVEPGTDAQVIEALNGLMGANEMFTSRYEAIQALRRERQTVLMMGTGISAILGVIGIFNFINVISVNLLVRRREIAALECIGMSKKQVSRMLRWEGAVFWAATLFLSLTIGNAIAAGLFNLLKEPMNLISFNFPFIPILLVYLVIILVCSLTPGRIYKSMSQLSLVERLREVD